MIAALILAAQTQLTYRWVYLGSNFYRPEAVDQAIQIVDRAAAAGYNGIVYTDTKLQAVWPYPDFYVKNVRRFLEHAREKKVEVIPAVLPMGYADSMLAHNPSLIESMPCKNVEFNAKDGRLVLKQDPATVYKNGDFETANSDSFPGFGFQDGAGKSTFADRSVKHGGATSLRIEDPYKLTETSGNARIMQKISLQPWHQYRYSAWIKTENFDRAGDVRAMVLDPTGGAAFSYVEGGVEPTQDWKKLDVVFNSQENKEGLFYLGVWGGNKGKMWVDDVRVEDVGLLNVTRRPGCPLAIVGPNGMAFEEGRDVEQVADPKFGNQPWPGGFDFGHEPPTIKLTPNSRIKDGSTVLLSYYHAIETDQGKTAICPSEPATRELIKNELKNVVDLFGPKNLFFAHDEIRVMNWCKACRDRNTTAGQLLADDVRQSYKTALNVAPGATVFIWSDMFDPFHNAVDHYYLCWKSVQGSWEGLQRGIVIVNWNSGRQRESLKFFSDLGFKQILAGYYDGPVDSIKPWMAEARKTGSLSGVMYTTWANRYDDLEAFAKAAWGG